MNIINCHMCASHHSGTWRTPLFEMSTKQQNYKARLKLRVAEFAEKHWDRAAGREFSVSKKVTKSELNHWQA